MKTVANKYGQPILKQRPAGDWVVDQYDYQKQGVRRLAGPYGTKEEAQVVYDAITNPPQLVTDRPWYD